LEFALAGSPSLKSVKKAWGGVQVLGGCGPDRTPLSRNLAQGPKLWN